MGGKASPTKDKSKWKRDLGVRGFGTFLGQGSVRVSLGECNVSTLKTVTRKLFYSLLVNAVVGAVNARFRVPFLAVTITAIGSARCAMNSLTSTVDNPTVTMTVNCTLRYPPLMLFSLVAIKFTSGTLNKTNNPLTMLFITVITTRVNGTISGRAGVSVLMAPLMAVNINMNLST